MWKITCNKFDDLGLFVLFWYIYIMYNGHHRCSHLHWAWRSRFNVFCLPFSVVMHARFTSYAYLQKIFFMRQIIQLWLLVLFNILYVIIKCIICFSYLYITKYFVTYLICILYILIDRLNIIVCITKTP